MLNYLRRKFSAKGLPTKLEDLKCVLCSYSQFGEDIYLSHLFGKEKTSGTYVDVGCYEPIHYSNTYLLYKRGWKGLCIDPNPSLAGKWAKHRPRDVFVNVGVSKNTGLTSYMEHKNYPALNFFTNPNESHPRDNDPNFTLKQNIRIRGLSDILEEHKGITDIDLLNIDCEGMDFEVLESIQLSEYRPLVICIEDTNPPLSGRIHSSLIDEGYSLSASIGISKVYTHSCLQ